jgi:hypothetical protein
MSTNQPNPHKDFKDPERLIKDLDRVSNPVNNPHAEGVGNADTDVTALDELRRKLCAAPPIPRKSKWRLW